jgi:hypothetical protein
VKQGHGQLFSQAISFSDIQKAWARKFDIVKTLSLLLLGVGLYIGWPVFPGVLFYGL